MDYATGGPELIKGGAKSKIEDDNSSFCFYGGSPIPTMVFSFAGEFMT